MVGLYAFLGVMLTIAMNIASKTTPTVLHVNYDSISAANRMREAWSALQFPTYSSQKNAVGWIKQFDDAVSFEETNLTEPGEKQLATAIKSQWEQSRSRLGHLTPAEFETMRKNLDQLVSLNEKGMFGRTQSNVQWSHDVLIGSMIFFFFSLILSIFVADGLSERLSRPLKDIAESLHRRPEFRRRLKLPEPNSLEILILTTELNRLWESLGETAKLNVAEIIAEKRKLETLVESVEDALLVLNPEGRVLHCNHSLLEMIGLSAARVHNQFWQDLPTVSDNYLKLRDALRPGMPEGLQVELEWKQGKAYFSARSRKIGSEANPAGTVYLLHDITEKKQREKFRSEFIDLLSHELKTPLQSLGTAAELLVSQKASLSEDNALLVDTISEDVERIRGVVQELVQITQSHAKVMKMKMELVSVNQLLPEWIKPFQVVAKDRSVTLELKEQGSEVIWANLDLVKFPWVVSNLLSNAVRFSPVGGRVEVILTDRNGSVELRVRDEGPGIPEAEQARVFEPFFQSTMTTASGARGLFGIGLTIAKEVVEAHDGRIEYHQLKPHGSEFRILLPFPPLQYRENPADQTRDGKSWTH